MTRHEREPQGRRDDGQRRGPKGPMTIRYRGTEGDEGRRSGGGKQTSRMRDGASTSGGETVSEYEREQTIRMRDEDEQDARTRGTRRRRTDTGQQTRRTRGSETDRARRTEDRAKRRSEGTAERRRVDATLLKNLHRLGRAVSPCSYKARLSPRPDLPRSSVGRDSSSKLSHCRLAPTSLVPRSAVTRLPSCRTVASPGSERRSHRRPIRPRRRDCRAPAVAETTHFPDVAGTRPARRREGERHVLWR